jgi:hypothetical protein
MEIFVIEIFLEEAEVFPAPAFQAAFDTEEDVEEAFGS